MPNWMIILGVFICSCLLIVIFITSTLLLVKGEILLGVAGLIIFLMALEVIDS